MDLPIVVTNDPAPAAPVADELDLVGKILEALRAACCELRDRKGAGPDDCKANRDMVVKCNKAVRTKAQTDDALLADWQLVIRRQLESVRSNQYLWKYLALSTLTVPRNFLRLRDAAPGASGSGPRKAWSSEPDESEDP